MKEEKKETAPVEQQLPSKEELIKFLTEQIEVKEVQVKLQNLNADLAEGKLRELRALGMIAQITNPQPPADAVPYTLTQEDLDADPSIAEQGFKAGDEVLVPKESEPAKRKLKK